MPKVSLAPELCIGIRPSRTAPLRRQLENGLRDAIETGRFVAGSPLPSTRILADQLGVSRGLVVTAYEQLAAEGYIFAARGSATRVAQQRAAASTHLVLATGPRDHRKPQYDFQPGLPDVTLFPRKAWSSATRRAIDEAPPAQLLYPDPHGEIDCRVALSNYLNRSRATKARPENIVMCSGFTQGIRLVSQALRHEGLKRIAMEDPGHTRIASNIVKEGVEIVPIRVDGEGMRHGNAAAQFSRRSVTSRPDWPTRDFPKWSLRRGANSRKFGIEDLFVPE